MYTPKERVEFHLAFDPPNKAITNWPKGAWSLYRVTMAQIAERTIWERVDGKLQISERWPMPGYVGMFENFDDAIKAIESEAQ